MYIKPTVGRKVWYRPKEIEQDTANVPAGGYMSAEVVSVEHPGGGQAVGRGMNEYAIVNLVVFDRLGQHLFRRDVMLLHDVEGDADCPPGCARWMPYQMGQAAKTEEIVERAGLSSASQQQQEGPIPEASNPEKIGDDSDHKPADDGQATSDDDQENTPVPQNVA